jgi:DNA-binding MarR family transcriptional regulator
MEGSADSSRRIAELLTHVGRRVAAGGGGNGFTPVQWSALRYFSRANRFSRTPSAFASYQATTRGTASTTINGLVRDGYLVRRRSETDGRGIYLEPSAAGYRLLEQDPLQAMEHAIGDLTAEQRQSLTAAIPAIIGRMADADGGAAFGSCHECCHLGRSQSPAACPYYCNREAAPLEADELDGLCVHFEPTRRS